MLPNYTFEEFWSIFEKLPLDIKEAIVGEKTVEVLLRIQQRYGLSEDQLERLTKIVVLVLLGLEEPSRVLRIIEDELNVNYETARGINFEVFRFIFFPVKESLEQIIGHKIERPSAPHLPSEQGEVRSQRIEDPYREKIE